MVFVFCICWLVTKPTNKLDKMKLSDAPMTPAIDSPIVTETRSDAVSGTAASMILLPVISSDSRNRPWKNWNDDFTDDADADTTSYAASESSLVASKTRASSELSFPLPANMKIIPSVNIVPTTDMVIISFTPLVVSFDSWSSLFMFFTLDVDDDGDDEAFTFFAVRNNFNGAGSGNTGVGYSYSPSRRLYRRLLLLVCCRTMWKDITWRDTTGCLLQWGVMISSITVIPPSTGTGRYGFLACFMLPRIFTYEVRTRYGLLVW